MTTYYVPDTTLGMRKSKTKVCSLLLRNWQLNDISALSGSCIPFPTTQRAGQLQLLSPHPCIYTVHPPLLQPSWMVLMTQSIQLTSAGSRRPHCVNILFFFYRSFSTGGRQAVWNLIFHFAVVRFHFYPRLLGPVEKTVTSSFFQECHTIPRDKQHKRSSQSPWHLFFQILSQNMYTTIVSHPRNQHS